MKEEEIKGVIFDLDGTLVDSYQAIYLGFHHVYTQLNLTPLPFAEVKKVVGRGLSHTFRDLLGEELVSRALLLFRQKYEEVFREHTKLLPDVPEVLAELHRRKISLAVASNKLGKFSRAIFEHFQLQKYFAVIVGDGDVAQNKPDPEMIYFALDKMGLKKEEVIFVGDSVIDIQTAKNAGMKICAIPSGNTSKEDLEKAQPTVLLERLLDLLFYVGKGGEKLSQKTH
jgi:2-phosphoglycolate phosphatase